jgi:hypothetical protein
MNPKYELAILMTVLGEWADNNLITNAQLRDEFTAGEVFLMESVLDSIDTLAQHDEAVVQTLSRIKQILSILKEKNG